ncbi:ADP-ribosylglycohydrolase family protein [Pararhizobium arenae]|uniref:ADP-ribosylglycohydrolase family protein n=1 Tax=Pararhizobium arenae TaxID=1856850 RepID=UPI00094B5B89|nr:ADP-ribosylglycohydrolase family protein [Pararhizobium arenae]
MKTVDEDMKSRAVGCLLGQLAGDALGSLVEFQTPKQILEDYPDGVRRMHDGGTWNTLAGQPTDDSEMALALARSILAGGMFVQDGARRAYEDWLASAPFDVGNTVYRGIGYDPNHDSQANGALMRVSVLGIFGSRFPLEDVGIWAEKDAIITHPNPICRQINNLFVRAIAFAVADGPHPVDVHNAMRGWADELDVSPVVKEAIADAAHEPPRDFLNQQGWVVIAFQNAVFRLLHSKSIEDCIVDTVMQGGDTDTNAAIAGALVGAVYGDGLVPEQWRQCLLSCRPQRGDPRVMRPRPEIYWPVDAIELAHRLLDA